MNTRLAKIVFLAVPIAKIRSVNAPIVVLWFALSIIILTVLTVAM